MTRRIAILGSTGSIGTQSLEVARWQGYDVVGLAAGKNLDLLLEQVKAFSPAYVACDESMMTLLKPQLPADCKLVSVLELAALEVDVTVAAIPGIAGLEPTASAMAGGHRVALAHKEAMVAAGPLMWEIARRHGTEIIPVDSEHSALFQSLLGEQQQHLDKLVLTASGGPFYRYQGDLTKVTPEQALKHPNWSMGSRITIDSATLFNKGLEVLEAHFLFDVPMQDIEVVVHPQSLIHGLVRFSDGSIKAQIGPHDMRPIIQYALSYPERLAVPLEPLPLRGTWELIEPDTERFPSLTLAYEAGERGGIYPAVLNAADEVAVAAFLAEAIPFTAIPEVLAHVIERIPATELSWESVSAANQEAKQIAQDYCHGLTS